METYTTIRFGLAKMLRDYWSKSVISLKNYFSIWIKSRALNAKDFNAIVNAEKLYCDWSIDLTAAYKPVHCI